jgi:hypothetical protein
MPAERPRPGLRPLSPAILAGHEDSLGHKNNQRDAKRDLPFLCPYPAKFCFSDKTPPDEFLTANHADRRE